MDMNYYNGFRATQSGPQRQKYQFGASFFN